MPRFTTSYPLFFKIISTRFFPISCTSPFTVASITFPRFAVSAFSMKAAVSHLEQFMEKADTAKSGKVMLATVKGDVHDIGKNLVEIILKNNGYDVINLGIKVPPEVLIEAFQEHKPDAIGLSGLLVKSAQQMVITANDLKDAGIGVPLLVGGAALSAKFTQQKIAPSYGGT